MNEGGGGVDGEDVADKAFVGQREGDPLGDGRVD